MYSPETNVPGSSKAAETSSSSGGKLPAGVGLGSSKQKAQPSSSAGTAPKAKKIEHRAPNTVPPKYEGYTGRENRRRFVDPEGNSYETIVLIPAPAGPPPVTG